MKEELDFIFNQVESEPENGAMGLLSVSESADKVSFGFVQNNMDDAIAFMSKMKIAFVLFGLVMLSLLTYEFFTTPGILVKIILIVFMCSLVLIVLKAVFIIVPIMNFFFRKVKKLEETVSSTAMEIDFENQKIYSYGRTFNFADLSKIQSRKEGKISKLIIYGKEGQENVLFTYFSYDSKIVKRTMKKISSRFPFPINI